jgi:hypothetical protein
MLGYVIAQATYRDDIGLQAISQGVIGDNKLLIIGGIGIIAFLVITARVRRSMTQGVGRMTTDDGSFEVYNRRTKRMERQTYDDIPW